MRLPNTIFVLRFYPNILGISCVDAMGNRDTDYEFDLFSLLPGEKMQLYTRLYFEGNTPTEIAKEYNVHLGTVSSAVTRSVQYLREYLKKEAV